MIYSLRFRKLYLYENLSNYWILNQIKWGDSLSTVVIEVTNHDKSLKWNIVITAYDYEPLEESLINSYGC